MRANYVTEIDLWHLILPTLLQGIPSAMFFVPLTALVLAGQPSSRIPAAAGLLNFARSFCGAIATSISATEWNNRTILYYVRLTEQASINNPLFLQHIAHTRSLLHLSEPSAHALFDYILTAQASMLGLDDVFQASAIIVLAFIPLIWITRSTRRHGGSIVSDAH